VAQAAPALTVRLAPETDFSSAIYGQVLAGSAVVALSRHDEPPLEIAAGVAATMLVFWVAHVYAEAISRSVARAGRARAVRHLAEREWPMVQAALPAVVALTLAALGLWSRESGITIALGLGVVALAGWGYAAGRRSGRSQHRALLAALGSAVLGLLIIALKVAIH
jgi:hypothetical protein